VEISAEGSVLKFVYSTNEKFEDAVSRYDYTESVTNAVRGWGMSGMITRN
jgi:hypothetical protein